MAVLLMGAMRKYVDAHYDEFVQRAFVDYSDDKEDRPHI